MHVERCFFPQQVDSAVAASLSATFVFSANKRRKKYLPLLFLTETSIAPSHWRGVKDDPMETS